ncbi:MAG: Hpt domain-containing protein [Omnitrophica WOR_2 bacterium]|jgi:HPt (histidine-containing phosphotransfer) domain-containing protein
MINKQEFLDTYNYFESQVLVEIIDIFTSEYAGRFEKLYADIKDRDYASLRFDAHGLKGVVANFCAPVVWAKARELEKTASELEQSNGNGFDESSIKLSVDELKECVKIMVKQLSDIRAELIG